MIIGQLFEAKELLISAFSRKRDALLNIVIEYNVTFCCSGAVAKLAHLLTHMLLTLLHYDECR